MHTNWSSSLRTTRRLVLDQGTLLARLGGRRQVEAPASADCGADGHLRSVACHDARLLGRLANATAATCVLAEGIAVTATVRWREIIEVAPAGTVRIISAPDAAIPEAIHQLDASGLYVEPTSAIVLAEFAHPLADDALDDVTMLILTSSGLKNCDTLTGRK